MQVRKKDTGRVYAMKVLQKANIIKRNQVAHTQTERNVLGQIDHPFIVGLNYAFQVRVYGRGWPATERRLRVLVILRLSTRCAGVVRLRSLFSCVKCATSQRCCADCAV